MNSESPLFPTNDTITVEFYGTARLAVNANTCKIKRPDNETMTLAHLLQIVEHQFAGGQGKLLVGAKIADGLIANLDGKRFTTDLSVALSDIDSVLLMSVDVGG